MAARLMPHSTTLPALIAAALALKAQLPGQSQPAQPKPAAAKPQPDRLQTIKTRGDIRIGVAPDLPGMAFRQDGSGQFVGAEPNLGRALAKGLLGSEHRVTFIAVPPGDRISAVQAGRVDLVIAQLTITPERQGQVDFSIPYITAHEAILVRADSPYQRLQDFQGQSVAVAEGSATEQRYRRSQPGIKLVITAHESGGVELVRERRVAGMANDNANLLGLLNALADRRSFRLVNVGHCFADKPFGIAMAKGNPALRSAVDQQLLQLRHQGDLGRMFAAVLPPTPAEGAGQIARQGC